MKLLVHHFRKQSPTLMIKGLAVLLFTEPERLFTPSKEPTSCLCPEQAYISSHRHTLFL
jgi:hypothetical protein